METSRAFAFGLVGFFALYVLVCVVWRSAHMKRETGLSPVVLGSSDSVYDFVGGVGKRVVLFTFALTIANAALPTFSSYIGPLSVLDSTPLKVMGFALLLFAFVLTVIGQNEMGKDLRIGIDFATKTDLVRGGVFRVSRNPIYVAMLMSTFGFFFVLPNALTLALLVAMFLVLNVQVRLEEQFLAEQHGEPYRKYCRDVRRWI